MFDGFFKAPTGDMADGASMATLTPVKVAGMEFVPGPDQGKFKAFFDKTFGNPDAVVQIAPDHLAPGNTEVAKLELIKGQLQMAGFSETQATKAVNQLASKTQIDPNWGKIVNIQKAKAAQAQADQPVPPPEGNDSPPAKPQKGFYSPRGPVK